ncbi:MAG: helix-turn-helix domain-containing protein [Candidatus Aenigmarchaeota archaeon]|nr:helix-turn-helix domain-containing protein [Candidatus Aenigmarchaeota archaeon]
MNPQKKFLTGMLVLTIFILAVALSSLYVQMQVSSGNACGCAIPLYLFVPLIGSMGLFIGVLAYYLLSPKFEKPPVDKKQLLAFFERNESIVMKVILENKGEVSQAEIVRQTGLPKVKVFRILHSLKNKGIITKERQKKINMVKLSEGMKKLLL